MNVIQLQYKKSIATNVPVTVLLLFQPLDTWSCRSLLPRSQFSGATNSWMESLLFFALAYKTPGANWMDFFRPQYILSTPSYQITPFTFSECKWGGGEVVWRVYTCSVLCACMHVKYYVCRISRERMEL